MRRHIRQAFAAFIVLALGCIEASASGVRLQVRATASKEAAVVEEIELYSNSHALVIGIDHYRAGWQPLSNAVNDARRVAQSLTEHGFDVTLRTNLKSLELQQVLQDFFLLKGADPEARLFVWYAGHGHTVDGEGYLIPTDGEAAEERLNFLRTALSLRRFGEFSRLAASKHVFAVFDSCFAGTIFNVARSAPPPVITRSTAQPVRQFMTSGDAGQQVSDDGTFATLFIEALRNERQADGNGDGYLTATELGTYLGYTVANLTNNRQTPRHGKLSSAKYDKGDFVFQIATPTATPPSGQAAGKPETDRTDLELLFWQTVKDSEKIADYEAYVRKFPKGTFVDLAQSRIADLKQPVVAAVTPPRTAPPPAAAERVIGIYPPAVGQPRVFRDCPQCPEMVEIPTGAFRMGDLSGAGFDDERPVTEVRIGYRFAVGRYEVTREEFNRFLRETGHDVSGGCTVFTGTDWRPNVGANWLKPGFDQADSHPVVCVSWNDARAFLKWLSGKAGQTYRLPTEAEWEYMARAGSVSKRFWGEADEGCGFANAADLSARGKYRNVLVANCRDGHPETAPVGRFKANEFGVHDVLGNVWEWVEDCWHAGYREMPRDGSARSTSGKCAERVIRGASWGNDPGVVRSASRLWGGAASRNADIGFRVARSLSR